MPLVNCRAHCRAQRHEEYRRRTTNVDSGTSTGGSRRRLDRVQSSPVVALRRFSVDRGTWTVARERDKWHKGRWSIGQRGQQSHRSHRSHIAAVAIQSSLWVSVFVSDSVGHDWTTAWVECGAWAGGVGHELCKRSGNVGTVGRQRGSSAARGPVRMLLPPHKPMQAMARCGCVSDRGSDDLEAGTTGERVTATARFPIETTRC